MLAKVSALAAESALVTSNRAFVESIMKGIMDEEGVKYCWIVKPNGKIFMSEGKRTRTSKISDERTPGWTVVRDSPLSEEGEKMEAVVAPIFAGPERWGLWIGFSIERLQVIQNQMLQSYLRMTLLIMALGFLVSLLLVREINYPLKRLIQGVRAVTSGNLDYQVKVSTKDEIGELATSFNKMTGELKTSRDDLQKANLTLEQRVEERTEQLTRTNEQLQLKNKQLEEKSRRLLEAQEKLVQSEKLAALGQLASSVGHELRNPLGVINNSVYYLKSKVGEKDSKLLKHLRIIESQIRSSDKIVGSLLDFSRRRELVLELIDINRLIEDILSTTQLPRNVELTKNLSTDLPKIPVDEDQIRQVLVNLISNAIQAMPEGGQLKIGTRKKGEYVEVEIADTGCGIAPEKLKKLFDPFFTTKPKGIGLGLAVVNKIVEKHDGNIQVKSEPGQGSTFVLQLSLSKQGKP